MGKYVASCLGQLFNAGAGTWGGNESWGGNLLDKGRGHSILNAKGLPCGKHRSKWKKLPHDLAHIRLPLPSRGSCSGGDFPERTGGPEMLSGN